MSADSAHWHVSRERYTHLNNLNELYWLFVFGSACLWSSNVFPLPASQAALMGNANPSVIMRISLETTTVLILWDCWNITFRDKLLQRFKGWMGSISHGKRIIALPWDPAWPHSVKPRCDGTRHCSCWGIFQLPHHRLPSLPVLFAGSSLQELFLSFLWPQRKARKFPDLTAAAPSAC